jgi:amino acid transporter
MSGQNTITVRGAVALGIGSMVGAGIFALLGEAAIMAGSAVWLSFLAAGIIALLSGYSFVQLGIKYPSRGGIVEYLVRAYGTGRFSGGCSILFYIAQLIGMAMVSLAFGKYAAKLIGIEANLFVWERVLASALVLGLTVLTLAGSKAIAKVQRVIVIANLILLGVFVILLSNYVEVARYSVDTWPTAKPIFGSLALTFFAFTGFAVISNAAERMANPTRDLPRAMYGAIGIVIALYLGLSLAVAGAVDKAQLMSSGPMLLVDAAQMAFGDVGVKILLISAVIATVTCINGGLFGVTQITFSLAVHGQLPSRFQRDLRASTHGLTISAVVALIMINFMTLTTVASLGSATSLLVYSLVNFGAFRLLKDGSSSRTLISLSVIACIVAILIWIMYTLETSPKSLGIFLSFIVVAFAAEGLLQRFHGRRVLADRVASSSSPGRSAHE